MEKREEKQGASSVNASEVVDKINDKLGAEDIATYFPRINRPKKLEGHRGKKGVDRPAWRSWVK